MAWPWKRAKYKHLQFTMNSWELSHLSDTRWLITCPPAAQAATSPYCPPSFCSLCATVVTSLQPVAPNGWPRDRDPPHRLNFSMGGVPTCVHGCWLVRLMWCCRRLLAYSSVHFIFFFFSNQSLVSAAMGLCKQTKAGVCHFCIKQG